jgi:hypothetical protein
MQCVKKSTVVKAVHKMMVKLTKKDKDFAEENAWPS